MRGDDILSTCLYTIGASWVLWTWVNDMRRSDISDCTKVLPGAYPCSIRSLLIAGLGAVLLVGLQVIGEYFLEIHDKQETIALSFIFAMLSASIIEEVVFRGFFVITHKGIWVQWFGIVFFSFCFALLHPYLWKLDFPEAFFQYKDWSFEWRFDVKALFTTFSIFMNSIWFYSVRFFPNNPQRSLMPCFVAHAVSNLCVFFVKYTQGFVAIGLFTIAGNFFSNTQEFSGGYPQARLCECVV